MLTLEKLKSLKPEEVFATGIAVNHPNDVYMTNSNIGRKLLWVAKRGNIHDWAIYIHWADMGKEFVKTQGDKLLNKKHIRNFVPCDDEAFEMYRF